jgi:hypothetical protein
MAGMTNTDPTPAEIDADREESIAAFTESMRQHDADREESIAAFTESMQLDPADPLAPLFDAALPVDAPGAWIRRALLEGRTVRSDARPDATEGGQDRG